SGHNLNDAMQPWAGMGQIITPASLIDHHALGYAYDTENVCKATFKFIDDGGTLKLADDHPTFKFLDDGGTFKLVDDGCTIKFADDGGGTFKGFDDVKLPGFDVGNVKFGDD